MKKYTTPLAIAATFASVLGFAGCGAGSDGNKSAKTVTFASYGGATTDNVNKIFLAPYAKEKGLTVLNTSQDVAKLYSMAESKNVNWDVVQSDGYIAKKACDDGILAPLSDKVLKAIEKVKLPQANYGKCHIQPWSYSYILAYNNKKLKEPVSSWSALLDTAKYPGGRTLWSGQQIGYYEAILLGMGVAPEDVYPIDLKKVKSGLESITKQAVITSSLVQQAGDIIQDRALLGILTSSRALEPAREGEPIGIRWDQQILIGDTYFVPKGAPNESAAMDILANLLDPKLDVELAQSNGYGPNSEAGREALAASGDCKEITTCPQYVKTAFVVDDGWWVDNLKPATDLWEKWATS